MNGEWMLKRTAGLVRKHIEDGHGWTIVMKLRIPFRVDGNALRYPFALVDEVTPEGPDVCVGTAKLFGVPIGRFRMTRTAQRQGGGNGTAAS
jgi:hypothetical protein